MRNLSMGHAKFKVSTQALIYNDKYLRIVKYIHIIYNMSNESNEESEPELKTIPSDPRYPNQNMTNWCFTTFVDHQRCCRLLGDDNKCCEEFAKIYKTICPNEWISRWENQIEIGTFPLNLPSKENDCKNLK